MFTTRIKEYRKKAGLKQADIAEATGVRRETIGNLERGKYNPSLRLAFNISKLLGATIEELFIFSEED